MSTAKMTPWFPDTSRPVRAGVYEIDGPIFGRGYAFFNGRRWGWKCRSIYSADRNRDTKGAHQWKKWRGLASDPKGGAA